MKLRNKKTGEIVDAESCNSATGAVCIYYEECDGQVGTKDCFGTLAELNEEWEDYKPAEPLIKDEKVRNLVREWIKLWETEDRWHVCDNKSGEISIARSDIELILPLSYGIEDGYYTIAELCGEEE